MAVACSKHDGIKDKNGKCVTCKRAAYKRWYIKNKGHKKEQHKQWCSSNRERTREYSNRWRRQHLYKITHEEYEQMILNQKGKCLICEKQSFELVIDHCHETNIVRGLLCRPCNLGIGYFHDSTKTMINAISYLEKFKCTE